MTEDRALPDGTDPRRTPGIGSAADLVDADAVAGLAAALVRLRTVNDPGSDAVEGPAASLLAETMRSFGWHVTVSDAAPGRPNVVAVIEGSGPGPTLMFAGHTDVVTEGDPAAWSFDPYGGDVVDDVVRGRGSAVAKGGLAAMVHAARAVEQSGFSGRVVIAALADSEGMMAGARAFAASECASSGIDGVVVCEPTAGEIALRSRGALPIRLELRGEMAHGAAPRAGKNPIPALGPLLVGLHELERQVAAAAGNPPAPEAFSLTPTVVAAGAAEQQNVIPPAAHVYLDVRTVTGTPHPGVTILVTRLAQHIAEEYGLRCRVDVLDDRPPLQTGVAEPIVTALADGHREITGAQAVFGSLPAGTDGTVLARDAELAVVAYGPGDQQAGHRIDESCSVAAIVGSARVYAAAAQRFLGGLA